MNCPRCKESKPVVIAEDSIKCIDCGKEQLMQYWFCACGFNFRANCGKLVDGWDVSPTSMEMSGGELASLLQSLAEEVKENEGKASLMDYVHPCIKCNSVTTYESRPGIYSCSACGFEWEILENG